MSTDLDQLLTDRFARLAPEPEPGDWADVLRRARRPAPRRALLVAALVAGALVVAGAALALSGAGTGVPAIDRLLDRAERGFDDVPPGAPVPSFRPQPGSVSQPLEFSFGRFEYTAVAFRAGDGSVCAALVDPGSRRTGRVGCSGGRLLSRALERDPLFLSGGGGEPLFALGFARADVERLRLTGTRNTGSVALSAPWRPAGPGTEPIRFFYVVLQARELGPRTPLLPAGVRLRARLADGGVTELRR